MNTIHILLCDVDGVLVEDRGYRAGVIATLNHYGHLMGLANAALDPASLDIFHAHGYTNEWDICPLAIGSLIVETLRRAPEIQLQATPLDSFFAQFSSQTSPAGPLDFARYVVQTDQHSGRPSERSLAVLLEALSQLDLSQATHSAAEAALREMLNDPYNLAQSPVTQFFQEQVLGSIAFETAYQRPPRFNLPALLLSEDRPLLNDAARHTLDQLAASNQAYICVYTARPSLPPIDAEAAGQSIGYSPEAELAAQLVQLEQYPLIAMGRMQWLAAQVQQPYEALTKPAPVQALAAIGAALSRREADSLRAAYAFYVDGELNAPLDELVGQLAEIWVVEDATLGLRAAKGAVDLLKACGLEAKFHGLGISNGGPKAEALAPLCEAILPDINAAIEYIDHRVKDAAK